MAGLKYKLKGIDKKEIRSANKKPLPLNAMKKISDEEIKIRIDISNAIVRSEFTKKKN